MNNANQEIKSGWSPITQKQRDEENCFRVVELGIPKGEKVTILASPRVIPGSDRKITFVSPDYTRTEEDKIGAEIQALLKSKSRDSVGQLEQQPQDVQYEYIKQGNDFVRKEIQPLVIDDTKQVEERLSTGLIPDQRKNNSIQVPLARAATNDMVDQMMPRFRFRILRGHSIGNLRKHRQLSMLAYAGLAVMGLVTEEKGRKYLMQKRNVTTHA